MMKRQIIGGPKTHQGAMLQTVYNIYNTIMTCDERKPVSSSTPKKFLQNQNVNFPAIHYHNIS